MSSELYRKLAGVRDLKKILETTVKDLGESFGADTCQIMLSNPLDPNVTSICEYRSSPDGTFSDQLANMTIPLVLHGRTFGSVSIARRIDVNPDEVNTMRVILGELGDIIRHAQINDIVQRDTFRETFLVEIGNVMAYSLGIGDALFMVVNILGKVLQASRCLFICTDDTQLGWKCYEYWQQEKVQSCQDYRWPTTDSPLIAQTLLSTSPLKVYEGQINSYVSPVQEELQFIGVKSLLGVALRSSEAVHGCVILQQCDYRRAWTRNEIDMVQNVADKVADALVKLPAEKRAREPIMQLHQRIVQMPDTEDRRTPDAVSVRKALKGALGQQAIPTAAKTGAPPPPSPKTTSTLPASQPPAAPPSPTPAPAPSPAAPAVPPAPAPAQNFAPPAGAPGPTISPVQSRSSTQIPKPAVAPGVEIVPGSQTADVPVLPPTQPPTKAPGGPAAALKSMGNLGGPDPYADLDFGDFADEQEAPAQEPPAPQPARSQEKKDHDPDSTWGNLDAIKTPVSQQLNPQPPEPASSPSVVAASAAPAAAPLAAATMAAPAAGGAVSQWGDLDAIATPTSGPAKAGLGGAILGRSRHAPQAQSPLLASLHKDKSKFQAVEPAVAPAAAPAQANPPIEIDEAAAKAKLDEILASKDDTSDYIFASPGLDMRMLGRIDGWVSQIEQKDKYAQGHAKPVAEYAVAIAREAGLSEDDIIQVRLAALVHDVGKMGSAPQILQKPDEDLSDPELITMMKHPLDGAELLESFPDLKHLAPIVRAHHEEYDGNGYPQGLKGDEIPVAARIIHVANSYHGMTTKMRYETKTLTPPEAQQELVKGAGKQWDPTFVQALIQALMSKKVPQAF